MRRFILTLVVAALACTANSARADFDYPDFSSVVDLNILGASAQVGAQLSLNPDLGGQTGAVWHINQEAVGDGFEVFFDFQVSGDGADGFAFVIQNETDSWLGLGTGSTMGYSDGPAACGYAPAVVGITQSIAIEFDSWDSGPCFGEPGTARHISIQSNGLDPNTGNYNDRLAANDAPVNWEDGAVHTVRVVYDPSVPIMRVYLDDLAVSTVDASFDLTSLIGSANAWIGFTSATGGVSSAHNIDSWSYSSIVPATNDACDGAIILNNGDIVNFDSSSATADGIDPGCGTGAPVDLWYRVAPICDGDYSFSTCGSALDTRIAIYDGTAGCPLPGDVAIACNDDSCGSQSELTLSASAGTVYYVQVGGAGTAVGTGTLAYTDLTSAPVNDECTGAIAYTTPDTFSTVCANSEGIDPTCGTAVASPDLWYSYTVLVDSEVTVSLAGSLYDTVVAAWDASAGCPAPGDIPIACNDDAVGLQSEVTWIATAGDTIFVQVTGFTGAAGVGEIEITEFVPPDVTGQHLVIDGDEDTGLVDSVTPMVNALDAAGITAVVITADQTFIGEPIAIYYMGGSFPDNVVLGTNGIGNTIAALIQSGTNAYVTGGDIWGFDAGTDFWTVDGIDDVATLDGNDTHLGGTGTLGGPLEGVTMAYTQDQGGNDWTDQLAVSTTDLLGDLSTPIFEDDLSGASAIPYNVMTFYDTTAGSGKVVCGSTEFGGYDDPDAMYAVVASLLAGGPVTPMDTFRRGDANDDGGFDISDAVYVLAALFVVGSPAPVCLDAADINDDGGTDISDAVYGLGALFVGGSPPPPAPGESTCGVDPTVDPLVDCDSVTCP